MTTIDVTYMNGDGDEVEATLPAHFVVCSDCEGHGTHLTPGMRDHAYTAEEFGESFDDEEREEYFCHGGRYDVTCGTCGGKRVVLAVNEEECRTAEQKSILAAYEEHCDTVARWDAEDRATYRGESGYRD